MLYNSKTEGKKKYLGFIGVTRSLRTWNCRAALKKLLLRFDFTIRIFKARCIELRLLVVDVLLVCGILIRHKALVRVLVAVNELRILLSWHGYFLRWQALALLGIVPRKVRRVHEHRFKIRPIFVLIPDICERLWSLAAIIVPSHLKVISFWLGAELVWVVIIIALVISWASAGVHKSAVVSIRPSWKNGDFINSLVKSRVKVR